MTAPPTPPLLFLDFETVWCSGSPGVPRYSSKAIGLEAYLRDPRFGVHMVGMAFGAEDPVVHHASDVEAALAAVDWASTVLVSHNAPFDGSILNWHYGRRPLLHVDTLALARLCFPRVTGHELGTVAAFLGLGEKTDDPGLFDGVMAPGAFPCPRVARRVAAYCAQDVALCRALYHRLLQAIARMEEIAGRPPGSLREVEIAAADATVRMTAEPVLELDRTILEPLAAAEAKAADGRLRKAAVFAEELRALGVEPETKPGKNGPIPAFAKTDAFMRNLLSHERPEVRALATARVAAQGNDETVRAGTLRAIARRGPLPAALQSNKTHTGRDAGGGGINLQNLPRESEIRRAIRAPEGQVLVAADLSQIEARVLAWIAGEDWLVEAFRAGRDPYREFAARMESIPVERVTDAMRQTAKSAYLGLTYGMGHGVGRERGGYVRFVRGKGGEITDMEAVRVHGAFRNAHPQVARFWAFGDSLLRAMAATPPGQSVVRTEMPGMRFTVMHERIHLPSGRVLWYPGLKNHARKVARREDWRFGTQASTDGGRVYGGKVVENIVQAVARDVLWAQTARIGRRLEGRARAVLRVHDEAIYLVPNPADAPFVKGVVEEEMAKAPDWLAGAPITASAASGASWADCK